MLTLTFEGFCAVYEHSTPWVIYTPKGHHPHVSLLVIRGEELDVDHLSWWPDLVTNDPVSGEQVCIWQLARTQLSVSAGGAPVWAAAQLPFVIDLAALHPGATFQLGPDAVSGGSVALGTGTMDVPKLNGLTTYALDVNQSGAVKSSSRRAERIQWTGDPLNGNVAPTGQPAMTRSYIEDTNTGGRIVFTDSLKDWAAAITNSAPGKNSLSHFHNYYDLLSLAAGDTPATLSKSAVPIGGGGPINAKTGINCIPPGRMPA